MIGLSVGQQCISGPIFTECARMAPDRTFDALVFLHFSAYLPQNLDIATIAGPFTI